MRTTFLALSCALALVACDGDTTDTDAGCTTCGTDSGTPGTDSGTPGTDSGTPGTDAGPDEMDAGGSGEDAGGGDPDAGGGATDSGILGADAMVGAECEWNFDCAADQRCTCTDEDGCTCEVGARGTLGLGEECDEEETHECASGICFGDNDVTACSAPCETLSNESDECGGLLPACEDIPFGGRRCAAGD